MIHITIIYIRKRILSTIFILLFDILYMNSNIFNMRIKDFRKLNNLTCREVAEKIGVSLQSMQRYENGKAEPNIEKLIKLSKLFGVSVDTLIGNDADIIDLTTLDEDRRYVVKKISRELNDVEVGQIIGVMKTFR